MPKVSVCIPSYNHEKTIAFTIESILNQSFQDFEIIISDDCSSDKTVEIAKSFKDNRITIIANQINSGVSINFNKAIKMAKGEFISSIASDDMMEKTRLEKTLNFLLEKPNYAAVFTYVQTINTENVDIEHNMMKVFNKKFNSRHEILKHFFYKENFICSTSVMIRKKIYEEIGFYNPLLLQLQDFEMWIKLLIAGYEVGFIEEKLTKYRIGNNLSSADGSGYNSAFFSRSNFEIEKVLINFLKIDNLSDFLLIFDNIQNKYNIIDQKYLHFYLLKEALETANAKGGIEGNAYKNFANNIAYNLLSDNEMREELFKQFNFGSKDFFKIISDNFLIENYLKNPSNKKNKSFFIKLSRSFKKRLNYLKNLNNT